MKNNSTYSLNDVLKELDVNKIYSFYALVSGVDKGVDRTGNNYLNLKLVAKDSAINAKKWHVTSSEAEILKEGKLVLVFGKVREYRNLPQFNIDNAETVNDTSLWKVLLPQPPIDIEVLKKELLFFFEEITDTDYHQVIKHVFDNKTLESFCQVRGGLRIHHNVFGGLLWHTVSILKAAKALLPIYHYLPINASLLYAGIILHDFGKIAEIGDYFQNTYSMEGKLLGHIVIASQKIEEIGKKLSINKTKLLLLQHLVLSSHGKLENASPREPMVLEAFLLSQLDNLDAKMSMLSNNFQNLDNQHLTAGFSLNNEHSIRRVKFWKHTLGEIKEK